MGAALPCVSDLMISFGTIDSKTFLTDYWQKKPLVIRQALPNFINPLSADELAGLALEEGIESRMVFETPSVAPFWQLKIGPFTETDFTRLPKTHWTLLVQGVDRWVPEVMHMLDHFDFIPQWRVDDVMVSFAVKQGSVGPHYDNYDVFLYQAEGRRKWSLTTQSCNTENYLAGVDLRIMAQFDVEEEYILEPGDMLYLPPHVGHHGVSLTDDCMTYSFGYRSYQGQELWDSFGDFLSEKMTDTGLYRDPNWVALSATSGIPPDAWENAKQLMQQMLNNETQLKRWFGCFATRIDQQAEQDMPLPLTDEEAGERSMFIDQLANGMTLERDPTCRMAYQEEALQLFINGCEWDIDGVAPELVKYVANNRLLDSNKLRPFLLETDNQIFLYELWRLQWLGI
jgi:50S ribosomal protein L16 3-hydroxylase